MRSHIIIMLTHHDVTVPDARALLDGAKDLPFLYWGFKDVGLDLDESRALVRDMKAAGKTSVLEVVNFEEDKLLEAADFAVECGVDYFTGGSFSTKVLERVQAAGMKYFPFCGDVSGSPIALRGDVGSITEDARAILADGADGVDLTSYRYKDGDPVDLTAAVVDAVGGDKLIVAGSINSEERIGLIQDVGPLGFTMGGALFDGLFVPDGTFRENLEYVAGLLEETSEAI